MRRYGLIILLLASVAAAEVRETSVGTRYQVNPVFEPVLRQNIDRLRARVREERAAGKLVGFVSIPLSGRGGGNYQVNVEVSEAVKSRLERRLGVERFFALAPGLVESKIPTVDGREPGGGDYMFMWTQILAGEDGLGRDFDVVYFVGPTDFGDFFGLTGNDDLKTLAAWMERRARTDSQFAATVATAEQKLAFLRYYSLRASVNFSKGAHDEWNIFQRVNRLRRQEMGTAEQIPLYFDGRQVSPGGGFVSEGYQLP